MGDAANLLRDAVNRIPVWTGEGTDVFTPDQWLARVEKARISTAWTDEQTMSFVYVSLRGEALLWWDTLVRSGIPMTYAGFCTAFRESYAPALTARTATVTLHEVKQGTTEKVVAYYSRVISVVNDLEKLLPAVQRAPAAAALDPAIVALAGFAALPAATRADGQTKVNLGITIAINHIGMQLFVAGLKQLYRDKMLEDMPDTLWAAFQAALALERIHGHPKSSFTSVNEISDEKEDKDVELEIDAVQAQLHRLQMKRRNFNVKPNTSTNTNKWSNKGMGKFDMKDVVCRCCKKKGHMQDVCFTRINKGLPCVDSKGVPLKTQPPKTYKGVSQIERFDSKGSATQQIWNALENQPPPQPHPQGAHGFAPPQKEGGYWTPYLPNFP